MDQVKTALSALMPGEPATHEGLAVVPLATKKESALRYILLEEGVDDKLVTIREISEGGSVPELTIENRSPDPLLIVDGEEMVGAKQNRVANLTMLIRGATTTNIPVSCVEAGRWSYNRPDFGVSDRIQDVRSRFGKLRSVRQSQARRGVPRSDQGRVWHTLAEEAAAHSAPSKTGAMGEMFERHAEALDRFVESLEPQPDQIGAVFSMGRGRFGLDLFDKPTTFAAFFPKLLRSYGLDTLRPGRGRNDQGTVEHAAEFISAVIDAEHREHPAVGLGRDIGISGSGLVAGGLVHDEILVHLTAFSEPGQDADQPRRGRYAPYDRRRESLRRRYER